MPTWAAAIATSSPIARRWLRLEIPSRRGRSPARTGSAAGTIDVARMKAVQRPVATDGSVQAAISVARVRGADRLRRRLSSIFQRAMPGMSFRRRVPVTSRAWPRIHGSICQSPRAQRC